MKAVNIEWDLDDDNVELSTEVVIPKEIENDEDAISDYLSDEIGYCHKGFSLI